MDSKFNHAIIGGTFDHFHIGHQALLRKSFEIADKVSIGITTSEMFKDKTFSENIQSYDIRKHSVEDFLKANDWLDQATILPINDKYGSILTDPTIDAIVVSPETEKVARSIVPERVAKGLSEIEIVLVPFINADDGQPVSSERIRKGQINSQGFSYQTFFAGKPSYHLPDSLRPELQKPIGEIYLDVERIKPLLSKNKLLITVGDIVTTSLLKAGIQPHLCIVDFRTRREDLAQELIAKHFSNIDQTIDNPHGTINPEIARILQSVIASEAKQSHQIIKIIGEEDLLALPAILLSPLGTLVIYGQYKIGMIVVEVTEEKKKLIKKLLTQFR